MLKPVIVATALVAVVGSSLVYAQQRFDGPRSFSDGSPRVDYHHRFTVEDVSAFADARIAALKAGLVLTPDQAKNWPPLEAALRNMVQLRIERFKARQAAEQQQPPASPFDRLARRADNMSKAAADLKQVADAGAPLYQSLDDAQKARFTVLARMLRPRPMMHGGWRDGRGPGGFGWGWRRFSENGEGRGMHRVMDGDGDKGSQP
jgi:hypothetical protein